MIGDARCSHTYPIAGNDEEAIFGAEDGLGCIWRADDELFHRRIAQRSCDGEHAVDPSVHDEAASIGDPLCLLCIGSFVVVRQTHCFAAATVVRTVDRLKAKCEYLVGPTIVAGSLRVSPYQSTALASPTLAV